MKKLLIMAGGTGGHVFPGLAVAKQLQQKGWQIRWLGTEDRMEAHLVPQHGIEIDFIKIKGIRGSSMINRLRAPFMIISATWQAWKHIKAYQPNAVLGMGGYVSGPGGLAAWLQGIPLILHEQNAVAGLTNRLLSKIATQVLQAFPNAFSNAEVVGNPVRQELIELNKARIFQKEEALHILVLGGSQGARILNETLPTVIQLINQPFKLFHQVGKNNLKSTVKDYQTEINNSSNFLLCKDFEQLTADRSHIDVINAICLSEFIDDMNRAYQWADLVICRSGALTVSELAAIGLPAIFVPFMHKDRQQALNADYLVNANAAKMVEQNELTTERLAETINSCSPELLLEMGKNAHGMGILDATQRVSDTIIACSK